ncbi:uncharacterized protein isoform X2 [Leptinotarsa decemlineata]|uniref:uncharacterized protein isoform X2 n=1 Tax=Leptinotarsa decemlineata TaxID=7539 RepID=UPI000C251FFC|nr:uncharacterized protein LOC111516773 isoform X2 [Leptinotarsa decemlineata]
MLLVENIESPAPVKNKNCICRNPKEKNEIDQIPPDDSAKLELCKRCCFNGKCTINQLLKICQEDPDIIMDVFKMATADEKCLPEVELTYDQPQNKDDNSDKNVDPQNKYHFLMVDNSTSLYVVQQQVPDNFRAAEQGDKKEDIAEIKEECNHETEDQERSQEIIEALLQNKEYNIRSIMKSSIRSSESKEETSSTSHTKSVSTGEGVILEKPRSILWSDSDDQTEPPINPRRIRRKNNASWDKSISGEEQEKSKNIVWSSESYQGSEETVRLHQLPKNWHITPSSSDVSSLDNTPSSFLELVIKKKKEQLSSEQLDPVKTLVGVGEGGEDKGRRNYWSRCLNCFKCKKKTKADTKSFYVLESTNEEDD